MLRKIQWTLVALGAIMCSAAPRVSRGQDVPKPGPEHEHLKGVVGTWDTVMDFGGQKSKGIATYKSICGGMWLESSFDGEILNAKFEGHGLDGYDQAKKKYIGIWVDSMSSSPMTLEGTYDDKTKKMTMTGEMAGPDGKPQKCKTVTEMKDKDHFTFTMNMVLPDGKDQPMFVIEYSRKK